MSALALEVVAKGVNESIDANDDTIIRSSGKALLVRPPASPKPTRIAPGTGERCSPASSNVGGSAAMSMPSGGAAARSGGAAAS